MDNNEKRYGKGGYRSNRDDGRPKDTAGRIVPRDKELEQAVLSAMMLEKDAYTTVCDLLKPESFYEPEHQMVYEAIQTLAAAQKPIDMLTVIE